MHQDLKWKDIAPIHSPARSSDTVPSTSGSFRRFLADPGCFLEKAQPLLTLETHRMTIGSRFLRHGIACPHMLQCWMHRTNGMSLSSTAAHSTAEKSFLAIYTHRHTSYRIQHAGTMSVCPTGSTPASNLLYSIAVDDTQAIDDRSGRAAMSNKACHRVYAHVCSQEPH